MWFLLTSIFFQSKLKLWCESFLKFSNKKWRHFLLVAPLSISKTITTTRKMLLLNSFNSYLSLTSVNYEYFSNTGKVMKFFFVVIVVELTPWFETQEQSRKGIKSVKLLQSMWQNWSWAGSVADVCCAFKSLYLN